MIDMSDNIEDLQSQMKDIEAIQLVASQILISLSAIVMFVSMFVLYLQEK